MSLTGGVETGAWELQRVGYFLIPFPAPLMGHSGPPPHLSQGGLLVPHFLTPSRLGPTCGLTRCCPRRS